MPVHATSLPAGCGDPRAYCCPLWLRTSPWHRSLSSLSYPHGLAKRAAAPYVVLKTSDSGYPVRPGKPDQPVRHPPPTHMKSTYKAALLGAAGMFAVLTLASFQSTVSQLMRVAIANPVELKAVDVNPTSAYPHPRDAVRINEGASLTVPAGKLLVLTGLGVRSVSGSYDYAYLRIDGQLEAQVVRGSGSGDSISALVQPLPPGLVAVGGQVVESDDGDGSQAEGVAWGVPRRRLGA